MKMIFQTAIVLLAPFMASASSVTVEPEPSVLEFDHTHAGLTAVYSKVVKDGLVDYASLRAAPKELDAYIAMIDSATSAEYDKWSREQRFAFWINTYNAYTIKLIRDEGPVSSIKKLGGLFSSPWEKRFIPLGDVNPIKKGKEMTLDEIEHKVLRPTFKDPRVHAAVNCASMGCPPLRATAFTAEGLDEQLTEQVTNWLADTKRNQVTPKDGKIEVSKIFDWFSEDFGKSDKNVVMWIAEHVGDEALAKTLKANADSIKVKYLDYSWKVNAQDGKS